MGNRKPCLLPHPARGRPAARPGTTRRRPGADPCGRDGPVRAGRGTRAHGGGGPAAVRERPNCGTGTGRPRYGDRPAQPGGARAYGDGGPAAAGEPPGRGTGMSRPHGRERAACALRTAARAARGRRAGPGTGTDLAARPERTACAVRGRTAGRSTGTAQLRYREGPAVRLHRRSRTRRSLHRRDGSQALTATRWLHPGRRGAGAHGRAAGRTDGCGAGADGRTAGCGDGRVRVPTTPMTGRTEGR